MIIIKMLLAIDLILWTCLWLVLLLQQRLTKTLLITCIIFQWVSTIGLYFTL